MTLTAILLIIVSAFTHAGWNLLGKARRPSAAYFMVAAGAAALFVSPILIYHGRTLPHISGRVWMLVAGTGVCQAAYFIGLGGAYRHGHLSLAYPLARAVPVVLVVLISIAIGRGKQIGEVALVGMVLVTVGCLVLPMKHYRDLRIGNYLNACCLFALLAAVATTGYSLIDDQTTRHLRDDAGTQLAPITAALLFASLQCTSTFVWLGVWTMLHRPERHRLHLVLTTSAAHAAATSLVIFGTYCLVLMSMAYVTNVSYVVAFRQLSIPLGAIMGVAILREPVYAPKAVGVMIITIGLVLVALG